MLAINECINDVSVDITLDKGLNCIDLGNSGTGKTFMMNIIRAYCVKNGMSYKYFDYNNSSADILSVLRGMSTEPEVILLDNADLYATDEVVSLIKSLSDAIVVISIKERQKLRGSHLCNISYIDDSLYCRRCN